MVRKKKRRNIIMLGFILTNCLTNKQCLKTSIFHVTRMIRIMSTIARLNSTESITKDKILYLVKLFKIDMADAKRYLENRNLHAVPEERIAQTYELCLKHKVSDNVADIIRLMTLRPHILERRIAYFHELGCTRIPLSILLSYMKACKSSLLTFQKRELLPANVDIAKNVYRLLNEPPPHMPCLDSLNQSSSITEYRSVCLEHYLKWRLEYTEKDSNKLIFPKKKCRFLSLRTIEEVIDLLEYELGFSKNKIRHAGFLLRADPINIKHLLMTYKQVVGSDMKPLLTKCPKLVDIKAHLLPERIEILKKHGVTDSMLEAYPVVLLLSKETIKSRLKEIQSISDLRGFSGHPRISLLIIYLHKVKDRLRYLKENSIQSISLYSLVSSGVIFNRTLEYGVLRTRGRDVLRFLSEHIGLSETSIHRYLKKHPMWHHASFIHVVDTYFCLIDRNYTNEDIQKSIHVVLYKSSRVQEVLDRIDASESKKSNNWTPSDKLALCVYYIEQKYHFSGAGVLENLTEHHLLTLDQKTKNEDLEVSSKEQ